jgi:hypothetical protein
MAIKRFLGVANDPIAGGSTVNLSPPQGVAATPSTTGGTLAAGTYYVRVTFLNAAGESAGSAEVSAVTTGATSSISVAWTTDTRATSARVYVGTTSGAQATYFTDADGVSPLVIANLSGTAGTVPSVSTARIVIPVATDVWPITGLTIDRNVEQLARDEEITGFRGNPPPEEFRKDPRETVSGLAYQRLLERLLWYCLGSTDSVTGSAPAARTHLSVPVGYSGTGLLPAFFTQAFRDAQEDRMAGAYVNRVTVTFSLDGHATYEAELWGLYHVSSAAGSIPVLSRDSRDVKTLKLRDVRVYFAGSPVIVPGVTSFAFTFTNNIVADSEARFQAGLSIDQIVDTDGVLRRVWYPNAHFLGGSQTVTAEIGFSSPQQAEEVKHELARVEQLVAEVEGPLMTTTPVAKEMMRFTLLNAVRTDGGGDALVKEGLQRSSFTLGGFIGSTGTDVRVEAVNNVTTAIV